MGNRKLLICIGEKEYQKRLMACLMNHYKDRYELNAYEEESELENIRTKDFAGCILGEEIWSCHFAEDSEDNVLVLNEENRYLGVNKLMEKLEQKIEKQQDAGKGKGMQVMGICSLDMPGHQIVLADVLAGIYGEMKKTLLIDLQRNSGLEGICEKEEETFGMEDVLAAVMGDHCNRNRIGMAIGKTLHWDYIRPMKNSQCLREVEPEVLGDLLKWLWVTKEYERVLLNLGEETLPLWEVCERIYFLVPKGDGMTWREASFRRELERRGKNDIFHRIKRVEIPTVFRQDGEWEKLSEQWKWSTVGDYLRRLVWEECADG